MKQLKNMKETLVNATQAQLANLSTANTAELGCAIDMIKDLSEAIYYCEIVESMKKAEERQEEEKEWQQQPMMYFREKYPYYPKRDWDKSQNRIYYPNDGNSNSNNNDESNSNKQSSSNDGNYQEFEYYPNPYEGKSPERRRTYMETRHTNDKNTNMKELEHYVQDLASDIVEMMQDATPEEKQMLSKKLNILSTKIQEV